MSSTIAHRPHVHIPLVPIIAFCVAVAVAAVLLWAINRPETAVQTGTEATTTTAVVATEGVPKPESRAARAHILEVGATLAQTETYPSREAAAPTMRLDEVSPVMSVRSGQPAQTKPISSGWMNHYPEGR